MPTEVPSGWFYARDRQRHGPCALTQVKQLVLSGELRGSDMVRPEGSQQWRRVSDCPELAEPSAADQPTVAAIEATPTPAMPMDPNATGAFAAPEPPSTQQRPPPVVPGYAITEVLGRGGMGVVYKAHQVGLNRVVALKMILGGSHAGSDDMARFRDEAETVAQLRHPNIVQIFEVGEHEGVPYFSLEYVDGGSLARRLDGTPQAPAAAAALSESLARAIHAAHEKGIIHRDLKPANVLLTSDGVPRIADFGLAKQLGDDSERTRSGTILGTPAYMAPEQAAGRIHDTGPRTDIYALGVILYEMLTGRPPFRAASPLDTLEQVRTLEPVPPRRLQPKVPRDLETVCLKCLQKEPSRRYASALELAEDLRRFQAGEPVHARPIGPRERLWKWAKRRPAVAGLSAFSAVVIGVSLVVSLWQWGVTSRALSKATLAEQEARDAEVSSDGHRRDAEKNLVLAKAAVARQNELLARFGNQALTLFSTRHAPQTLAILEEIRASQETLVKEYPTERRFRVDLATTHSNIGIMQYQLGRLKKAEETYQKADAMLAALGEEAPNDPALLDLRASNASNWGNVLSDRGDSARADAAYASACAMGEKLCAANPSPHHVLRLARYLNHRGTILHHNQALDESDRCFLRAQGLLEGLRSKPPRNRDVELELAGVVNNRGSLLRPQGKTAEALECFTQARRGLEALAAEEPNEPPVVSALATCFRNLASAHADAGRMPEAIADSERGLALSRRLVQEYPALTALKTRLLEGRMAHANLLARAGKHAEAASEVEELVGLGRGNGLLFFEAACILSLSARAAAGDEELTAAERSQRAEQSAARAVALLRQSRTLGFDAARFRKEPDLAGLRDRADFKAMLVER